MPQLYELVVQASGVVRDADGNIIATEPVEMKTVVTEEQAAAIRGVIEGESA